MTSLTSVRKARCKALASVGLPFGTVPWLGFWGKSSQWRKTYLKTCFKYQASYHSIPYHSIIFHVIPHYSVWFHNIPYDSISSIWTLPFHRLLPQGFQWSLCEKQTHPNYLRIFGGTNLKLIRREAFRGFLQSWLWLPPHLCQWHMLPAAVQRFGSCCWRDGTSQRQRCWPIS